MAAGTILNLAPGASDNSSMTVRLNDTMVGAHSGSVPFNPTSVAVAASGLANTALTAQTLTVNGSIYRAAVFTAVAPNPVQLANIREGGTFAPVAIAVNNGATNFTGFTESLSSAFSGAAANVTAAGSVTSLAPGATNSSAMTVALTNTATAGAKSGTVNVTGTSIPVAGSGLSNLPLTSQSLTVQGSVFRLAIASTHTPEPVAFGVRHVGDIVPSQALSVANNAANDGFSERLNGGIGSATGGVTTNGGSFTQLAPGAPANLSLGVGISTVTAGNKNGTATISLLSDGTGTSGLAPLAITAQTVNVTGQVNFFADPLLFFKIGSAVLQQIDATHFKLDFGQLIQNTGSYTASFGVRNVLHDGTFQDTLGGTFNTASVTKFTLAGFTSFSGIASGSAFDPDVTFSTARPQGTYSDTLFINPSSANASGTSGLGTIQLDLGSQVVPEPGSALLLALGGGLFLIRRRRN